jgi:CBS domain containing-hemolysin-like protein
VIGLSGLLIAIPAVPALAVHLASIALMKALHSYSRSRLEEYCASRARPERAEEVSHLDERAEKSAEAIAVLSGVLLAALCGVALDQWSRPPSAELLILIVLLVGGVGYVLAGVLGEVLAEPILYAFWPAVPAVLATAWPLTRGYAGVRLLVERLAGIHESGPRPASVEVEIPAEEGASSDKLEADLPEGTRALVQRAVELSRTDVSEIMRPSAAIVSLPSSVTSQVAAETFRRTGRSRIPLYGANRDDVVGILLVKDLLDRMVEVEDPDALVPASMARPAFFVPETANALQLIEDLRGNRTQMAIVLDEYGAVAGLVTLEDLLEQIVGLIDDEHDVPTPEDPIRPLGGARYEVDATLPLEVLNDRFGLELPTDEEFQTVGGFALHALGRLPERGASFRLDGMEFTVLDVQARSIRRVIIDLQPVASTPESP